MEHTHRHVGTVNTPGEFIKTDMEGEMVHTKMEGRMVEILTKLYPKL